MIGPGLFLTEGLAPSLGVEPTARGVKSMTALGRFGEAEEFVEPSLFLLRKAASSMTGEVVVDDGGSRLTQIHLFPPDHELEGVWTHKT